MEKPNRTEQARLRGQKPISILAEALKQIQPGTTAIIERSDNTEGCFESRAEREVYEMVCSDNTQTFAAQPIKSIMALINRTQYWIGLKEPMEQGLLQANAEFVQENYPNLTPQRWNKAFSLALVGKLNVDANHYGAWTPRYAAQVLNAYNAMEQKVITKVRYKASLESPPDDTPLSQLVARAFRVLFDDKKSYEDETEAFWADEIVRWKLRNAYALMQRYEAHCNNYGATKNKEATEDNINNLFSRLSMIYAELSIWDLADGLEVQCPSIFCHNLNERATP